MLNVDIVAFNSFVTKVIGLGKSASHLSDYRQKPEIPISKIFKTLLYTYILGKNTLLSIDQFVRRPFIKRFLKSKRKMVVSDSTLERVIPNFNEEELSKINYNIFNIPCFREKLVNPVLNKRLGILDGSGMSGFLKEVCIIPGRVNFILDFFPIVKKGKELVSADRLIKDLSSKVGKNFFDLFMFDGLYYSWKIFEIVKRELGAFSLVKTSERLNIVKDLEDMMKGDKDKVNVTEDYDSERMTTYIIHSAKYLKADTIKDKLQVAIVTEKNQKDEISTFYIITNDNSLDPKNMRYAAHSRWRIENNGFKTMNHLFRTKRKISKNEALVTNLMRIIFIAYNLLELFLDEVDIEQQFSTVKVTMRFICEELMFSLVVLYYNKEGP